MLKMFALTPKLVRRSSTINLSTKLRWALWSDVCKTLEQPSAKEWTTWGSYQTEWKVKATTYQSEFCWVNVAVALILPTTSTGRWSKNSESIALHWRRDWIWRAHGKAKKPLIRPLGWFCRTEGDCSKLGSQPSKKITASDYSAWSRLPTCSGLPLLVVHLSYRKLYWTPHLTFRVWCQTPGTLTLTRPGSCVEPTQAIRLSNFLLTPSSSSILKNQSLARYEKISSCIGLSTSKNLRQLWNWDTIIRTILRSSTEAMHWLKWTRPSQRNPSPTRLTRVVSSAPSRLVSAWCSLIA